MDKFFSPSSIAVIGASANPEKTGYAVLKNIIDGAFPGEIYPINPHETEILGKSSYKSLFNIPTPADLAIIVIPAPYVPGAIKEAAEKGIKHFVIISAGFGEIGETGIHLDTQVEELIQQYDLHIMGPNCLGVIAPHSKLNAAFGGPLPSTGNVALPSQSGAIISSLTDWADLRHFGFSKIVSLGNTLQLNENECLQYLENDDKTEVITLFLKHFQDKKIFLELCHKISQKKTIILYKSGTKDFQDEKLNQELLSVGIIRAHSLEELYNLTHICSTSPIPKGNQITVITNAGGPGVIASDRITESEILTFAEFSSKVKNDLITDLPAEALPTNPIDLIGDAKANLYEASLDIVLKNNATDSLVVILSPQAMTQSTQSAQAIITAKNKFPNTPLVACFIGGRSVQEGIDLLLKKGIPCFLDPTQAIWAIESLNFISSFRR